MKSTKLGLGTKLGYGIGDLGGNLFFTIVGIHLLIYFTDTIKLAPFWAGLAIAIGRVWDAVTDPVVGYLSDRTRTPWGRRRPYIFVGSLILFIFMIVMFTKPHIQDQFGLFLWAALTLAALNLGFTFVNIPYSALTPELTKDYNERTVLNGFRMMFAVVGTFCAAVLVDQIVNAFGADRITGFFYVGLAMGSIILVSGMVVFFSVHEQKGEKNFPRENILKAYLSALKSRPFLLALIPWVCHITGITFIMANIRYFFKYIYGNESLSSIAFALLLLFSFLCIPIWVLISKRIGKKLSYNIGMAIFASAVLSFFFFGELLGPIYAYITMVIGGMGFAAQYVIPYSIIPDIVEHDYLSTGERREGVFYALWNFFMKLGQALAAIITGICLSLVTFNAETATVVGITPSQNFAIKLLNSPIPVVFFLLGIIVMSYYPITKEYYEKIRQQIQEMESK